MFVQVFNCVHIQIYIKLACGIYCLWFDVHNGQMKVHIDENITLHNYPTHNVVFQSFDLSFYLLKDIEVSVDLLVYLRCVVIRVVCVCVCVFIFLQNGERFLFLLQMEKSLFFVGVL